MNSTRDRHALYGPGKCDWHDGAEAVEASVLTFTNDTLDGRVCGGHHGQWVRYREGVGSGKGGCQESIWGVKVDH